MAQPDLRARIRGSLLGGAVGDALGAPVEFWSLAEIRRLLGPAGVTGHSDDRPSVTDGTQMTVFTAEGLIRASVRMRSKGIVNPPEMVHRAYLRWLETQGTKTAYPLSGWLVTERHLHHRRAPGNTCLSALASGNRGSTAEPINDSKGCGGVMRAAPVGLFVHDPIDAFTLGCDVAALTHGHPSGWLPAGVLAATIAGIGAGTSVRDSLWQAARLLDMQADRRETRAALDHATMLATRGMPSPEDLETLGGGWVGEEALAIAVCCALAAPDFRAGVLAAVNHSGNSASTGSIAGNLLGALLGEKAIPPQWIAPLDLADLVGQVADDLWTERCAPPGTDDGGIPADWWARYPGA